MFQKEALIQALQHLTPDQLQAIVTQGYGRSPIRPRQLTDLRLAPTATDPRPTWVQETDGREFGPTTHSPFPRLLWRKDTGQELTVWNEQDMAAQAPFCVDTPPSQAVIDPVDRARQMFEALSPEDQAFVLEHQRQARIAKVNEAMANLSEGQVAAALANPPKKGKRES